MSSFKDKALELLNLKNFASIDSLQMSLDEEIIRIADELKKLNKRIDNIHVRIDKKEEQLRELEMQKQIKLDEIHELFYKEI
jgi:septal ring factor EnvC (AmiA/AmiB activator)